MKNLINELFSKKVVLVPFAVVCTFVLECNRAGINCEGGEFKVVDHDIIGQYFYL